MKQRREKKNGPTILTAREQTKRENYGWLQARPLRNTGRGGTGARAGFASLRGTKQPAVTKGSVGRNHRREKDIKNSSSSLNPRKAARQRKSKKPRIRREARARPARPSRKKKEKGKAKGGVASKIPWEIRRLSIWERWGPPCERLEPQRAGHPNKKKKKTIGKGRGKRRARSG